MPEFDRTIAANEDGTANAEDIQRWLDEWDTWQVWVNANRPNVTLEVLAVGYVPGSVFDQIHTLGQNQPDAVLLGELYRFEYIDDTSDLGDGFQTGRSMVISATPDTIHSYHVADGSLQREEGPHTDLPALPFGS